MKIILFCQNPYALAINKPVHDAAVRRGYDVLWYISDNVKPYFNLEVKHTDSITELIKFSSDAIIAPGNEVPYYLRGVKVQIFHGFAGEKKGHFHIRHYFDLYLTQGPYFTREFNKLKKRYKNFDVKETGWPKLDVLFSENKIKQRKYELKSKYNVDKIVLYAPTFSPSLTSAKDSFTDIFKIAEDQKKLLMIKFHDLMDAEVKRAYEDEAEKYNNVIVHKGRNIIPLLVDADIMISDTSSVIYEFLILNKPVISINTRSKNPRWVNLKSSSNLIEKLEDTLANDTYKDRRKEIISEYHPYNDGKSSERVLNAIEEWIKTNGIPEKRNLSFLRRMKIHKRFGKPENVH